jgi:hypothetical protein
MAVLTWPLALLARTLTVARPGQSEGEAKLDAIIAMIARSICSGWV